MEKVFHFIMAVAVLVFSSLACRTFQVLTGGEQAQPDNYLPTLTPPTIPTEPEQTPTAVVAAATPTETPQESGPLILDDFSDRNSGWKVEYDENYFMDYYQGGYRISLQKAGVVAWATAGLDYDNVQVLVDARLIGGDVDNYLGVVCRHQNIDNFYTAVISSDGYYAIQRRLNGGVIEVISGDYFQESIVINQQAELNLLEVSCVGSQIKLVVNGQQLAEVTDTAIPSGDVGVIVGTFTAESTDVLFDNFTVNLEE